MQLIDIRCTILKARYFIKCFERTDSDLIVAKLFVLRWNDVALPFPTFDRETGKPQWSIGTVRGHLCKHG